MLKSWGLKTLRSVTYTAIISGLCCYLLSWWVVAYHFQKILLNSETRSNSGFKLASGSSKAAEPRDISGGMSTAPLISVVMPVYNEGWLLEWSVESVVGQTYSNWELLIVEDGSTDPALNRTLHTLIARDQRIKILWKRNGGLADARNAGIRFFESQNRLSWVLPLDGDDLLSPDFMEKAVHVIGTHPHVNLVISDLVAFRAESSQHKEEFVWHIPAWVPWELAVENKFHCCGLFSAKLWVAAEGYSPALPFGWEDWDFWIRVARNTQIVPWTIRENLFHYRLKPAAMHNFCQLHFQLCKALLKTLHPDLYPYQEVTAAHETIMGNSALLLEVVQRKIKQFPEIGTLYLWRGLLYEKRGKASQAIQMYQQAILQTKQLDWQPFLTLEKILLKQGNHTAATLVRGQLDLQFSSLPTPSGDLWYPKGNNPCGSLPTSLLLPSVCNKSFV